MGNKKNQKRNKEFSIERKETLTTYNTERVSWFSQSENDISSAECDIHSASFHKIEQNHSIKFDYESSEPSADNYIINIQCLQQNLDNLTVCAICKCGVLKINEDRKSRKGCVPQTYVECSNEQCSLKSEDFIFQPKHGYYYDINKRVVIGARAAGGGESATEKLFAFLGLPPPPLGHSWSNHQCNITDDIELVAEDDMARATEELKSLKIRLGESDPDAAFVDVTVSFDGTWNHVGHSASFCCVFAISVDTGKVIDYDYKYKICKMCKFMEGKKGTPEYEGWKENHVSTCTKTHDGSSSSMEAACIVDLYRRSLEKRGLRYTVFVGDGDSSSYRSVLKERVYGPDTNDIISKENCVGHVQKRMGTRLRQLLQESKGIKLDDGKGLSGRGRLTQKVVDSFQVFYGIALRSNKGDVQSMQRATRAIVKHYTASPDNDSHDLCPTGEDSWCKFQVDKACGTDTYKYPKYPLPESVCKAIEPIFSELSSEKLLSTCKQGLTQNPNEACHSMLWRLVSKRQYNSETAYRISSALTLGHWNSGQEAFNATVCAKLDIPVSAITRQTWRRLDNKRVRDGDYKNLPDRKERRKEIRKETLKLEDAFQKAEGKTYQSGQFLSNKPVTVRKCKTCGHPRKGHPRNVCPTLDSQ